MWLMFDWLLKHSKYLAFA